MQICGSDKNAGRLVIRCYRETYSFLAVAGLGQDKVEEALESAQRALVLGQRTENNELIAEAWRTLGLVATRFPDPIEIEKRRYDAPACFGESLRLFTDSGMEAQRARVLSDWSRHEVERGKHDEARAMTEKRERYSTRLDGP